MKICIPTADDRGLDAAVSGHFGSAPFFTFVDSETGEVTVLPNGHHPSGQEPGTAHGHRHGEGHGPGGCGGLSLLGPQNCEAVACRGMGRGAQVGLARAGIALYVAEQETVSEVLAAARAGSLRPAREGDVACGGHHGPHSPCGS